MNNPTQLKHKKMTLKVQYEDARGYEQILFQKFRKRQIKNFKQLTNPLKKNAKTNKQTDKGNYSRSENLNGNNKENTNGRNPGTPNNILKCISA